VTLWHQVVSQVQEVLPDEEEEERVIPEVEEGAEE
jgi:hypothetical protein